MIWINSFKYLITAFKINSNDFAQHLNVHVDVDLLVIAITEVVNLFSVATLVVVNSVSEEVFIAIKMYLIGYVQIPLSLNYLFSDVIVDVGAAIAIVKIIVFVLVINFIVSAIV